MLSIIIPAHNEENYVAACLQSIKQQPFSEYEIIVVCDSCTDKTLTIAKKYTRKVFEIKKRNVSAARNYGANKAKGDVLVFLDADSTIAQNLLAEINKAIKEGYSSGVTKTRSLEDLRKAKVLWSVGNFFRHLFIAASGMLFCKANVF